ncbi:MAG: 50S ribosomal protein L11 methyltransferase, partial [Thermodesulfobacteriota bacterium]
VNGLSFSINGKFDLIVSNIFAETLIALKEEFRVKMNDNGLIILSGIKEDEKKRVIENYKNEGFNLLSEKVEGGWAGLLFNINLHI